MVVAVMVIVCGRYCLWPLLSNAQQKWILSGCVTSLLVFVCSVEGGGYLSSGGSVFWRGLVCCRRLLLA